MRLPKGIRSKAPTSAPIASAPAAPEEQAALRIPLGSGHIGGPELVRLLESATASLEENVAAVDALNVFPVPDGDTGTNMLLTMRSALDGAAKAKSQDAGEVMRAIARGAVMGARGNSGVILSQIIAGYARGLEGTTTLDAGHLAQALVEGATTAYRAVTRPVEGTILTVARAAGEGAVASIDSNADSTPAQVLEAALVAAAAALARTPEQLPILKQAGVVDAGGEGYRIILQGMLNVFRDEPFSPEAATPILSVQPSPSQGADGDRQQTIEHLPQIALDAIPEEEWGYCTQFVIQGMGLDLAQLRQELQDIAASALVVGDEELVRVHGHTEDPGQLLSYAVKYGRLQRIYIEDMDAQHDEWLRTQVAEGQRAALDTASGGSASPAEEAPQVELTDMATVAIAPGSGISDVLKSLGAAQIVAGGQTMNPSASDIVAAARRAAARTVVVLPNNGNVVMTAQQASRLCEEHDEPFRLVVVPSRTVPQGIAAQVAFAPEMGVEENIAAMTAACASVRTVEITRATRSVTLDSVEVKAGDTLGLLDDHLVTSGLDTVQTALETLAQAGAADAEIITLYQGAGLPNADVDVVVNAIRHAYPGVEVEVVLGGQPHYDFIISVE